MRPSPTLDMELAALAAVSERRNRPRLAIVVSCLLLLAAAVYALTGSGAIASAKAAAQRAANQAVRVQAQVDEVERALAETAGNDAASRFPPDARLRSKLAEIATAVGLPGPVEPEARVEQRGLDYPLQKQVVTVNLTDAPLEATLQFISRATDEIPGLYVDTVQFRPVPQGWFSLIRFARWEVKQ